MLRFGLPDQAGWLLTYGPNQSKDVPQVQAFKFPFLLQLTSTGLQLIFIMQKENQKPSICAQTNCTA